MVAGNAACCAPGVLNMLTAPALTCVFLGVVIGLGAALVWLIWESEQMHTKPHRDRDRFLHN
jgi:hypothetical protein